MELLKYDNFDLGDITRLGTDGVIVIDESHYIGAFISTTQMAPVTLDGLRYNLIDDLDLTSDTVSAEVYRVPTGVVNSPIQNDRPKAFKFKGMVIYENRNLESEVEIYSNGNLVGLLREISQTDRLIILTEEEITPENYHILSKIPHRFDKDYITQEKIQEFNTMLPGDTLGGSSPEFVGIPSAFSVHPPFERVKVGAYLKITGNNGNFIYSWEPIYRNYDQPYLPAMSNKFI